MTRTTAHPPRDLPIAREATILAPYRYTLSRTWWHYSGAPRMAIVMLNPSIADALRDDQTIRRCMYLAHRDGYGGIDVVNLYSLRATNPRELDKHEDPIGPHTRGYWSLVLRPAGLVVAAWGCDRMATPERVAELQAVARRPLFCWGTTASGVPRHPSRLPNAVRCEMWKPS